MPPWAVDTGLVVLSALDAWINLLGEGTPVMWACAAVGSAGLFLRRRFPRAVFLLTLPMTLFMDVAVAPIAALNTLAASTRNRPLLVGCALLNAAAGTLVWPLSDAFDGNRAWTLVQFVYTLATAFTPVLLGQLVQARHDVARRLVEVKEAREHEAPSTPRPSSPANAPNSPARCTMSSPTRSAKPSPRCANTPPAPAPTSACGTTRTTSASPSPTPPPPAPPSPGPTERDERLYGTRGPEVIGRCRPCWSLGAGP